MAYLRSTFYNLAKKWPINRDHQVGPTVVTMNNTKHTCGYRLTMPALSFSTLDNKGL